MPAIKPSLALVFLSPFIGEVLSSNVPASLFVTRPVMVLFAFVTYSVPVLLIRDWWVRQRLSIWALLLCGLAYGIFNEGLLARTLLMEEGLPIPTFNYYLIIGGVNVSWAVTLLVWHAIFSVATPILLVHELWPQEAGTPWLSKGWTITAVGITLMTSLLFLRKEGNASFSGIYYILFAAGIIMLVTAATRFTLRPREPWTFSWLPLLVGLLFFGFFGGLFVISALGLSAWIFFGYATGLLGACVLYLNRSPDMEKRLYLFCVGNCMAYSVFVFLAKLRGSMGGVLLSLGVFCCYFALVRRAYRVSLDDAHSESRSRPAS